MYSECRRCREICAPCWQTYSERFLLVWTVERFWYVWVSTMYFSLQFSFYSILSSFMPKLGEPGSRPCSVEKNDFDCFLAILKDLYLKSHFFLHNLSRSLIIPKLAAPGSRKHSLEKMILIVLALLGPFWGGLSENRVHAKKSSVLHNNHFSFNFMYQSSVRRAHKLSLEKKIDCFEAIFGVYEYPVHTKIALYS